MEGAIVGSFGGRQLKDTGWSGQSIGEACTSPSLQTSPNLVTERSEDTVKMEPITVKRVSSLPDSKRHMNRIHCNTDHLECIKRQPAGRLRISLSQLMGVSVKAETAIIRELKTNVIVETAVTVCALEVKKHIGSKELCAVINNVADPDRNLSPEWADPPEAIIADRDIQLDVPTPDYSSQSEDEDGNIIDTLVRDNTSNEAHNMEFNRRVELQMLGAADDASAVHGVASDSLHNEVLPKKLARKGSVIRRKKKKKLGADVASLSEPEDIDRSRRTDNDEIYANGVSTMQSVSVSSTTAGERQTSKTVKNQSAAESRRYRPVQKTRTMGNKQIDSAPQPEHGTLIDITFQPDSSGYGFQLVGGNSIRVMTVSSDSPADLAGLRPKDILCKVNGFDMFGRSPEDALNALEYKLPMVKLSVLRKNTVPSETLGRRVTLGPPASLTIQKNPTVSVPSSAPESNVRCKDTKILTLEKMHNITAEELKKLKIEYQKNPNDNIRQQVRSKQKVLDSLMQEKSVLVATWQATIGMDSQSQLGGRSRSPQLVTGGNNSATFKESGQRTALSNFSALKRSPIYLADFVNFIISNGHNPAAVFFTLIAEEYAIGGTAREMNRWAGEIYATFLASHAPLALKVDSGMVTSIKNFLLPKNEKEIELNELKSLFLPALHFIQGDVSKLLAIFCEKKVKDHELDNNLRPLLNSEEEQVMGQKNGLRLWKTMELYLNLKTAQSQALASCITILFGQLGMYCGIPDLSKYCPSFVMQDKRAFWLRHYKKIQLVHSHSLLLLRWFDIGNCDTCNEVIWTAFNHGLHCQGCGIFVHKDCTDEMNPSCSGTARARANRSRSRSKERLGLLRPSYEPVETQLIKTARRSEVISSVFHVPLPDSGSAVNDRTGGESGDELHDTKVVENSTSATTAPVNMSHSTSSNVSGFVKVPFSGGSFASSRQSIDRVDPDMEVEPELPSLESIIPKEELRKLKQKEKKRQEVINELFYTERVHVCKLKVLYKFFFRPILKNNLIDIKHLSLLFSNIEDIFNVHRNMSEHFKTRRKENIVVSRVGDILVKHFDGEKGEHMQQACAKFCRDQSYALETLRNLQRQNAKLAAFIQEATANPLCGRQQLRDLLLCEMQRLVKYPLLIDSLLKYTQQDTVEYKNLLRVNEQCRDLLHYVNEEVREQENWRKADYINRRLDRRPIEGYNFTVLIEFKELCLTQHRLIHDGKLTLRLSSSKAAPVYVMLFDDIIVLVHQQDDKYSLRCQSVMLVAGKEESRMYYSPIIRLRDLFVRDNAADKCALFLVSASKGVAEKEASQYDLVAKTKEDRKKWFSLISTAVEAYKKQPPGIYVRRVKSDISSPDTEVSPHAMDKSKLCRSSQSLNSLDFANSLLETEVPDLIQPSEVTHSFVTPSNETVVLEPSAANMRRKLSSVYCKLNEKRKLFAQSFSTSEDDADSVFERDLSFDNWDSSDLITASVDQLKKLQHLLDGTADSALTRVVHEDASKSSSAGSRPAKSLTRGVLSASQRSCIARQLQYHEKLLVSLDAAGDSERESLLSDLQESQGQINVLLDNLNVQARLIRQSAVSPSSLFDSLS